MSGDGAVHGESDPVEETPEGDDRPGDTMRERAGGSTRKVWLLLGADRWLVTGLLSAVVFVGVVVAGIAYPVPAGVLLARGDPVETLFQALVGSTVTGVTIVLTLSQLVLSQELGAVGDQRDRMEGATSFRSDVAGVVGADVSPAEPSAFLRALVRATGDRAERFGEAAAAEDLDPELRRVVERYVDSVTDDADAVADRLDGATFGEFDVVKAALDYNYSWKIYAGKRIEAEHGGTLSEEATDRLGELLAALELFGPAREHFKTLYFQWELSDLSRVLLYVAVPALTVAVATLLFFRPGEFGGTSLGVADSLLVLSAATTVSLLPFTILLSYILRIVTVTKRTLSIGPFVLRETDRSVDLEVGDD